MTLDEAYEIWLSKYTPKHCGENCIHGFIDGGTAFHGFARCELCNHSDVSYGGNFCPRNCKDFELNESVLRRSKFWDILHTCPRKDIISEFGIDPEDIVEIQEEKRKQEAHEYAVQIAYEVISDHLSRLFSLDEPCGTADSSCSLYSTYPDPIQQYYCNNDEGVN